MSAEARKKAPPFKAKSSMGGEVSLEDFRGKYLVLYFYPRAFTPGCTIETKGFRDALPQIRSLNGEVAGISDDPIEMQCRFAEEHGGSSFPILSDEGGTIAKAFRVRFPIVGRTKRVTFVIDPEGYVVARFHHELMFSKHIEDVVAFLKSRG